MITTTKEQEQQQSNFAMRLKLLEKINNPECPYCGHKRLEPHYKYCPQCGYRLPKTNKAR
jgi:DNA-directed RNA polymerase subunit RPC12/RpoP